MEPVRLQIEIDPGSDPISGKITEIASGARAFQGWLELTEAIEGARATEVAEAVPAEQE